MVGTSNGIPPLIMKKLLMLFPAIFTPPAVLFLRSFIGVSLSTDSLFVEIT